MLLRSDLAENFTKCPKRLMVEVFSVGWVCLAGQKKAGGGDSGTAGSKVLVKEKKAATQLGVIVGAFIFCWLPYFILFMVVAYCDSHPTHCTVPFIMEVSTTWCGYLNSTLNPILYPLCNRNFKIAFKRMLRMSRKEEERTLLIHK